MPRYVIERSVPNINEEELTTVAHKSIEILQEMPGVEWIKSYVSVSEGKIYCEYEAPNPEAIIEHSRRTGIPVDRITLVQMEVDPSMFR